MYSIIIRTGVCDRDQWRAGSIKRLTLYDHLDFLTLHRECPSIWCMTMNDGSYIRTCNIYCSMYSSRVDIDYVKSACHLSER
jgi:hypothetical protein